MTRSRKERNCSYRHKGNLKMRDAIFTFSQFHISLLSIMNLEILTPEKKLYSGEVYGVQMPGVTGSFEVLDKHAPLISALKPGRVKVLKDKQNHFVHFDIQSGFVEVMNNKVTVLVEGAEIVE